MYTIKQLPEDFIVTEVISLDTMEKGDYSYWELKKKNRNTLDCVRIIARKLRIPEKYIGFSGTKDKVAITSQVISLYRIRKERVEDVQIQGVSLTFAGFGKDPIHLGMHDTNRFMITVRNIQSKPVVPKTFVNFFGEQRFSGNNAEVGKAIIQKDFKKACGVISQESVKEGLVKNPTDYVGALRTLPKKLLKLYVHSYQSRLWNETVRILLENASDSPQQPVPMVGFGLELFDDELSHIIRGLMESEGIGPRDFIIRAIPDLSAEGEARPLYMDVQDLEIGKLEHDDLNKGKKKCVVKFSLGPGSYATVLIDQLFQEFRQSS